MKRYVITGLAVLVVLLGAVSQLESPAASSRIATVPVVVAQQDMPGGVAIERMDVAVAQWPAGIEPAGAYGSVDSVAGRVTRVAIFKGEAIVPGRLAEVGAGLELGVRITQESACIRSGSTTWRASLGSPSRTAAWTSRSSLTTPKSRASARPAC